MDALVLSCSTGGGHNAAGAAIKEELIKRGHNVVMLDPYTLKSEKLAKNVGQLYVSLVQHSPKLFGVAYNAAEVVRRMPGQSPVYFVNIKLAKIFAEYLKEHKYDVIVMTHIYPAELITYMKRHGYEVPTTIFVATDYVCIPFTEESDCDYYVTPGAAQNKSFIKRHIPKEKLLPFGIPVRESFETKITKEEARATLGLDADTKYVLITGGSIGASSLPKAVYSVTQYFKKNKINGKAIVICGNNKKLYEYLDKKYGDEIIILERTDKIATYMRACDIFVSKPGGLSSTEAAVMGVPYIHINAIPGCESFNMKYFVKNGMSIKVTHFRRQMGRAINKLSKPDNIDKMIKAQREGIPANARKNICDWIESGQCH